MTEAETPTSSGGGDADLFMLVVDEQATGGGDANQTSPPEVDVLTEQMRRDLLENQIVQEDIFNGSLFNNFY